MGKDVQESLDELQAVVTGVQTLQPWVDFMKANGIRRLCVDEIEVELGVSPGGPLDDGAVPVVTVAKGFVDT